jgi:hypothetical protein
MVPGVRWESIAIVAAIAGCGGDECVYDTDCPLFTRCDMGSCHALGGRDAGADASRPDGGSTDGGTDGGVRATGTFTANTVASSLATSHSVSGLFVEDPVVACPRTTMGSCSIERCPIAPPMDAGTADAGPGSSMPVAGQVTVMGDSMTLMIDPASSGQYAVSGTGALYTPGAAVTLSAAGAEVPAFSLVVNAPDSIVISAPDLAIPLVVPRASDYTFTFAAPTVASTVTVALFGSDATTRVSIACEYDSSTGTAVVPATVLAELPSGTGNVTVSTETAGTTAAGAWDVSFHVGFTAVTDEGLGFSAVASFE